ncbi:MAG: phytoene desaturase family protein [Opitutales bacterium]
MSEAFDVLVVGSGHNALITAAYLAKAGHAVGVFERRPVVGGAVCTQDDLIPGYQIDVGSSAHVMIHSTPVIEELDLAAYGLEYLPMDPWAFYPETAPSGDGPGFQPTGRFLQFHNDVDATCQSIAQFSARDAEAYARFVKDWGALNEGVFDVFLKPPTAWNLVRTMAGRQLGGSNRVDMVRKLMGPYGQLVTETFESEVLRTAIIWLAAQSGPHPAELASGDFAGWHAMYHKSGMKRAKGGSGALTQALKRRILADGGSVFENAPVRRIRTASNGRVSGIELEDGTAYEGKAVVAGCHVLTTLNTLLADTPAADPLRERAQHLRLGNGFGMIVRCAMEGLPAYPGMELDERGVGPGHRGLQLLCPSRDYLDAAHADFLGYRPPDKPVPLVMTFSALDDTLAPSGKHVMFVWGQYHPYELRNGEDWDSIEQREADKLIDAVEAYAPGTRDKVIDRYVQTPLGIERLHGLLRGNVMHLEMSFDQMFLFRPMPELAEYRVPQVPGLYLTGASTHPGGGVWGASGYNTAQTLLRDRKRWR